MIMYCSKVYENTDLILGSLTFFVKRVVSGRCLGRRRSNVGDVESTLFQHGSGAVCYVMQYLLMSDNDIDQWVFLTEAVYVFYFCICCKMITLRGTLLS